MDFLNPNGFWSCRNEGRIINQGFLKLNIVLLPK
jgi:hypothetical protein